MADSAHCKRMAAEPAGIIHVAMHHYKPKASSLQRVSIGVHEPDQPSVHQGANAGLF